MTNDATADSTMTRVELVHLKGRIERWLRFGRAAGEQIQDRRRRTVLFAPGAIFAFVRWRAEAYGTVDSRIAILRAVAPGHAFTTYPEVAPGAEVLLDIRGWAKVQAVLEAIDRVEGRGLAATDVAPDYWRHVGARIAVGLPPRIYERARHRAWLVRREIFS
ncbi:DUF2840 domain-containing protein [Caulobacter sp. UNC279MFTsu5.1]|uniref:DUF2840 domain-containing protein n=1 Tax=Caulobacter sp. UNC279MFTsu5.1 TaxID=1502775 RepID=UPI0008E5E10B|nr:DUF2840 domain-containing protein [Caulobacter sp. UNC279MFTsu5.1]SFI52154.1 Protein of unknown function [Caulobacter sp. UNC279MFTsu5.1]